MAPRCVGFASALFALLFGCSGGDPTSGGAEALLYIDLLRYVPEPTAEGKGPAVEMSKLRGDTRPALVLRVPRKVELGPLSAAGDCTLHFAFGASRRANKRGGSVVVKAWVRRGESDSALFSEEIDPSSEEARQWQARQIEIPHGDGPFSIVFGSTVRRRKAPTRIRWSSPHLRCSQSLDSRQKEKPDVILISLDTLRRDRLGVYGYEESISPTLNELAEESVVFDNAFSVANYTLPTHASMFTGLYPAQHRAGHASLHEPLSPDVATLAEILGAAGYATVGFSAGGTVSREMGIDRGFSEWNERRRASFHSNLPAVFDAVGRHRRRPLFLFLHTYDIHAPYELWKTEKRGGGEDEEEMAVLRRKSYHRHHQLERFSAASQLDEAYDGGIRTVDSHLKLLFDYLKEAGVYDNALIIVTSDHGESLFEGERYYGHGHSLGDQEIRVPLLVRLPGARRRGRESAFVQPLDLLPMILDETGVAFSGALQGRNPLAPASDESAPAYVVGESSIMGSKYIRSERWKLISPTAEYWQRRQELLFEGSGDRFLLSWQVYDLASDALEERNLFGQLATFPPEVRKLTRALRELEAPGSVEATAPPPTGELAEHLRALGYVQ